MEQKKVLEQALKEKPWKKCISHKEMEEIRKSAEDHSRMKEKFVMITQEEEQFHDVNMTRKTTLPPELIELLI